MNHSGVARVFDAEDGRLLTREGRLVGTAEYMSPELVAGDGVGSSSLQADVLRLARQLEER